MVGTQTACSRSVCKALKMERDLFLSCKSEIHTDRAEYCPFLNFEITISCVILSLNKQKKMVISI